MSEYINPLYLSYKGSSLRYEKTSVLKTSQLWIICLKDGLSMDPIIYQSETEFEEYAHLLTVLPMPSVMLANPVIRGGLIRMSLQYFDIDGDDHIVYLMPDNVSSVKTLVDIIKPVTINDIIIFKKSHRYCLEKSSFEKKFLSMVRSFCDLSYWQEASNCIIPTTTNRNLYALLDGVGSAYTQLKAKYSRSKLEFRDHSNAYDDTTSVPRTIKHYPEKLCTDKQSEVSNLINLYATPLERYHIICYLLMSKRYCHFVFCQDIMPHLLKISDKPVVIYLLAYAWTAICRDQASRSYDCNGRSWFDVSVAIKLPTETTWQYCVPLVKGQTLKPVNRSGITTKICDQDTITHRLKLFVGTQLDIDWSKTAITGSAMAAVIPYQSPLMYNCGTDLSDDVLLRYFDKYYTDADVDMICEYENLFEFIDHVISVQQKLKATICTVKTISVHIEAESLKQLCKRNVIPFTYDYVLENRHNSDVRGFFYKQYVTAKMACYSHNAEILNDLEHPYTTLLELGKVEDVYINIVKTYHPLQADKTNGLILSHDLKDYRIREVHRFKLVAPNVRTIEMFNTKSIKGTVSTFHLPCVRAYYKPQTTVMTALAITSYLTGWCSAVIFRSSSRKPFEILYKYHKRGYGVQLTEKEGKMMSAYAKYSDSIEYKTKAMCYYDDYYQGKYVGINASTDCPTEKFNPYTKDGNLRPLTLDILFK